MSKQGNEAVITLVQGKLITLLLHCAVGNSEATFFGKFCAIVVYACYNLLSLQIVSRKVFPRYIPQAGSLKCSNSL